MRFKKAKKERGDYAPGLAFLDFSHSLKLPEYNPQFFILGDIALSKAGQTINWMGTLSANVGKRVASATLIGNIPKTASCQRM